MTDQLLIIFVRNPRLGEVKTRLAASIGAEATLQIYQQLLQHTKNITQPLPFDKVVFFTAPPLTTESWHNFMEETQTSGDLGEKMQQAFDWGFQKGYQHICIIGSDCYELHTPIILQAFAALEQYQVVVGPTHDGGYYLLGMNRLHPQLFQDKTWSSDQVLPATLEDLQSAHLSYQQLETLGDIDLEQDLPAELKALIS